MPTSGGRPYEVLVVSGDPVAANIVASALKMLEMEGLPQPEPLFDVSVLMDKELSQATRYARNIVMVSTGIDSLSRPLITYERNVYAQPQLVLHVKAATASQLQAYILYYVRVMARQLVLQELNNGIARLRENHGQRAGKLVQSMFGVRLWVPEDLTRWKCGDDFLWLSNDAAQGMQNICIYRYAGTNLSQAEAIEKRDSVMRVNMKGEAEDNYMTTTAASMKRLSLRDKSLLELRGLWEMHADAMGGPFVSLLTPKGDSMLVAEAFIYAPGMKKRNLMRRLEACLNTLKTEH